MIWTFLIPAMQLPDELAHYFKVVSAANSTKIYSQDSTSLGADIPTSIVSFASQIVVSNQQMIPFNNSVKFNFKSYNTYFTQDLNPTNTIYTAFTNTATKLWPVYAPSVFGAFLGLKLNLSPVYIYFIAKLFSLIFFAVIGFVLIRKTAKPFREIIFGCLLLPMSLFLASGITADTVTILVACIFTATIFSLRVNNQKLTKSNYLFIIVLTVLLGLIKSTYAPMALLIFLLPRYFEQNVKDLLLKICLVLIPISTVAYTIIFMDKVSVPLRLDIPIDPSKQLLNILTSPIDFFIVFATTIKVFYLEWFKGLIGNLGWLDTPLPSWTYLLGFLFLFVLTQNNAAKLYLKTKEVVLIAFVLASSLFGVFFFLYLLWNSPEASLIEGFQGRYLLPFLPLMLISLQELIPVKFKFPQICTVFIVLILLVQATWSLYSRYYI